MFVEHLALEEFRNYATASVDLDPGLNLVVGRNAQGKTNLLEAVYLLGGLGSPRAADTSLVRTGAEAAFVHADISRAGRSVRIDLELRAGKANRALVNRARVPSVRSLTETFVPVYFGPDDLDLVKGGPDARRRSLDELIVKRWPARHDLRIEFDRVLRQRNALLKSMPPSGQGRDAAVSTLDVWDEAFARAGAALTASRLQVIDLLRAPAAKHFGVIAGGGEMELSFESRWLDAESEEPAKEDLASLLLGALVEARPRELERRIGLVGPQRDDLRITVTSAGDRIDARLFASQGEQRTAVLALKLAEMDVLRDGLGDEPVVLLDDVFSELDEVRRRALAEAVGAGGQTIVSCTEPVAGVHPSLTLAIEAGSVVPTARRADRS